MDSTWLQEKIWRKLPSVSKPARYVGNEWNSIRKEHDAVELKVALAFPELYEIGMSNLGIRILYGLVNQDSDMLAERVFAPQGDMEELMRKEEIPLFSLESFTPVREFDVLGFSLQHELNYLNVINMLSLAGLPLCRSKDEENLPLVVGGGTCTFNPEPLAPFFDLFVLGEGEEVFMEILEVYRKGKREGLSRGKILEEMAGLGGVYVPAFYSPCYDEKGYYKGTQPVKESFPGVVTKRMVQDLDSAYFPLHPIVPYMEVVHDRAVLEIARGCPRGCRFCHAGIAYRPARYRSPEKLSEMAGEIIDSTGYEEMSLVSLSSSDYPYMEDLLNRLSGCFPLDVNLSLPSQRLDAFSVKLAEEVQKRHQTSLTFAPEAGTERLRRVINKDISEKEIFESVARAFEGGWRLIKLYFMIGLPTERDEDLEGIYQLCSDMVKLFKEAGYEGKLKLSISVSTMIPKPHTPFQWEPQIGLEESYRRINLLRRLFSRRREMEFKWHEPEMSLLESALSRGGRDLAGVLEAAWRKGSRLDNWSEHFNLQNWEEAFSEEGLSLYGYAQQPVTAGDELPWAHLSTGVSPRFLLREHQRAMQTELSPSCKEEKCAGCGLIYCSRQGDIYGPAH